MPWSFSQISPSLQKSYTQPTSHVRKNLGAALSATSILVDSRAELAPVITRHLGGLIDQPIATNVLQALRDAPHWDHIQVALIRLAEYLDKHDVPIDYARRRHLDSTDLLSSSEWDQSCERVVQSPGAGARHHVARYFLFERISGLPGSSTPRLLNSPCPSGCVHPLLLPAHPGATHRTRPGRAGVPCTPWHRRRASALGASRRTP